MTISDSSYSAEESALLEKLIMTTDDEDLPPLPTLVIPTKEEVKLLSPNHSQQHLSDDQEKLQKRLALQRSQRRQPTNIHVLIVTACAFGLFVIAEIIGALVSTHFSLFFLFFFESEYELGQ
jgi:hypothetical protein